MSMWQEARDDSVELEFSDPESVRVPCRPVAVRIRVPTDGMSLDEGEVSKRVAYAVRGVFRSELRVEQVEFLSFPATMSEEQVYLVTGSLAALPTPPTDAASGGQATLHESIGARDEPDEGSLGHLAQVLRERLRESLPAAVRLDVVRVDFSYLGVSAVPTSRFATRANRRIPPTDFVPETFGRLLERLRNVPHLYQVLIQQRSQTQFEVSVRVALCGVGDQLASEEDLASAIRNGYRRYPVKPFDDLGLASNRTISEQVLTAGAGGVRNYGHDVSTDKIRALARGYGEFDELLQGRIGFDSGYETLGWYPKFVINNRDLQSFVGLPALTHPGDPWSDAPGRHPPALTRLDRGTTASTATSTPDRSPAKTANRASHGQSQKDGGATHQWWVKRTATVLRERGYDVEIVDQTEGGSVPDLWCRSPDGEISAVEVESKNDSKPANLLTNVVRADRWNVDLIIVGTSKPKASHAANKLSKPFKRTEPDRTLLYNTTTPVQTDTDATVLLPEDVRSADWWLTPDDDLTLELDGDVVTTGPATDSTSTFDYPTPTYRTSDGTHIVETSDGATKHRYDTKSALKSDWSFLYTPLVPTKLTYIDQATFKYGTDDALEPFRPSATWDIDDHMTRYEHALEEYFQTFTIEQADADLPRDTVRDHALTWYRHQTQYKEPNNAMFGRCSPDSLTKKANSTDTGKDWSYDHRTWRYSPDLHSPDLPDISHHPGYPDNWDDHDDADDTDNE